MSRLCFNKINDILTTMEETMETKKPFEHVLEVQDGVSDGIADFTAEEENING
jgi:hypothetical protein